MVENMQRSIIITRTISETLDDPLQHKWEKLGLGKAPFQVVGLLTLPSATLAEKNPDYYNHLLREFEEGRKAWKIKSTGSCDACFTPITNHFVIKSADGKTFVVGSECVKKTYDDGLVKEVKTLERKKKADADKFRLRSNKELFYSEKSKAWGQVDLKLVAIDKKIRDIKKDHYEWFIRILDDTRGDFAQSYANKFREDLGVTFEGVSDKVYNIFADIYAKYESDRAARNTKAYKSAEEAFHDKAEASDKAYNQQVGPLEKEKDKLRDDFNKFVKEIAAKYGITP
jgi:hypothetical protein